MAKGAPIMPEDNEKFMAHAGLIQWTQAAFEQAVTVTAASDRLRLREEMMDLSRRLNATNAFHTQCHFFVISANKVFEYRKWSQSFGLFASVDFSEIDQFAPADVKDLRNKREHIVEYFQGKGNRQETWVHKTPLHVSDASSVVGTLIGGRLDWVKFGAAAERLLPKLLAEPIPFPEPRRPRPVPPR